MNELVKTVKGWHLNRRPWINLTLANIQTLTANPSSKLLVNDPNDELKKEFAGNQKSISTKGII